MEKRLIILGLNSISSQLICSTELPNSFIFSDRLQIQHGLKTGTADSLVCGNKDELSKQLGQLSITKNDLIISIGCPWILDTTHLELTQHRALNLHGTHLPLYRGGTIHSWYILNRKRIGMCLLHKMTDGIDAGGIVAWREYIIPYGCRKPIDHIELYGHKNVEFLSSVVNAWNQHDTHPADNTSLNQPEYLSSYWPRLKAIDQAWIDWQWSGLDLESFICAFDDPYYGAQTRIRDQVVRLKDVYFQPSNHDLHPFQYGQIFRRNSNWLNIAVRGGELIVTQVLSEDSDNLINKIKEGERLYSTSEDLNNHHIRVFKSKQGLRSNKYW